MFNLSKFFTINFFQSPINLPNIIPFPQQQSNNTIPSSYIFRPIIIHIVSHCTFNGLRVGKFIDTRESKVK